MSNSQKNSVKEMLIEIFNGLGVFYVPLRDLELKGNETYMDLMQMATDYVHSQEMDEQEMTSNY